MKIYLVRHAEAETWHGKNLTKRGVRQSKFLGRRLRKIKFDAFYCSEINRSRKTAEVVSRFIGMKPEVESCLNEYESSDLKNSDGKWPRDELRRRKKLYAFIDGISKNRKKESNVLIVAHGIANRIIISYLLKISLGRMIVFRQNNTCVNELFWHGKFKNWRLDKLNDDSHLLEKLKVEDKR